MTHQSPVPLFPELRTEPDQLRHVPQAVVVAEQIKASRGYDVLDEQAILRTVACHLRTRAAWWGWWTLFLVLAMGTFAILVTAGTDRTFAPAGLPLGFVGIGLCALTFRRFWQKHLILKRETKPFIRAYWKVMKAAQPDYRAWVSAHNKWVRDHDFRGA